MKKQTSVANILRTSGIKVSFGKIAKADFDKAVKVLAGGGDKSITENDVNIETDDGLIVTIPEVEFNYDYDSDYGADADGNRGRATWFVGDINYDDPTHGIDEEGNSIELTSEQIKEVQSKIEKMAEDKDISNASVASAPEIKAIWGAFNFKSMMNSSTLRERLFKQVMDLSREYPQGVIIQGKDGNNEVHVFMTSPGIEPYSKELKAMIKAKNSF